MKKVKRPVTEEKKNIAATHAVMDKVNLIGDKFKIELANKTQFAQDHLDEVIKEKEEAEKKHARITSEVDEIKVSLSGGLNAKEDLLQKIAKLDDIKGGLQKEINALNGKINTENENIEALQEGLKKTETNQSSLGREMRECESRLAQIQDEKADKDAQIQSFEDKCNHLNKLKIRLEKSLDEVEDSWEREKKQKGDIEKLKRQVEGNLKLTQETITDLER